MSARLKLEAFDDLAPVSEPQIDNMVPPDAVEDVRLSAYEKGYAAGWDDALAAQAEDQTRIREDLARNLGDLSFTYQEARTHVLRSLDGLLHGMTDRILPELAKAALGPSVVAEVLKEADQLAETPVEIVLAPSNRATIEAAFSDQPALPVTFVEEPTLSEGQVHFRLGQEERVLDLDTLLERIRQLVGDFLSSSEERQYANG